MTAEILAAAARYQRMGAQLSEIAQHDMLRATEAFKPEWREEHRARAIKMQDWSRGAYDRARQLMIGAR